MKSTYFFTAILLSLIAIPTSCGHKPTSGSDPEVEDLLYGTWVERSYEDGMAYVEEVSYRPDNTLNRRIAVFAQDFTPVLSIVGKGTWYATKDEIIETIDVESIGCDYMSSDYIGLNEVAETVETMRNELKDPLRSKIIVISTVSSGKTTMTLEQDGETSVYKRSERIEPQEKESTDNSL
ncbi:MAG: hypothetical protein K2J17_02730 [Paramuribaculum sp.]|nr:hypothetical protein [Paramuribaculum sp.]